MKTIGPTNTLPSTKPPSANSCRRCTTSRTRSTPRASPASAAATSPPTFPTSTRPASGPGGTPASTPSIRSRSRSGGPKVKHLLHIEWGADSHARRHAEDPYAHIPHIATGQGTAETGLAYRDAGGPPRISRDGDWSETYACDLFDWHLKTQETLDWFTGSAQWIFKDFTTPLRAENPVPRINQKGVLERDLTQKESYFVFQSYWTDEKSAPMVRIYGHTWPVRWGKPSEPRTVRVYSNCPSVELFLNGKSLGVKKRNSQDFPVRRPALGNAFHRRQKSSQGCRHILHR